MSGGDYDYDDGDFDESCMTCGGDGYAECDEFNSSEGCWHRGGPSDYHRCPNCGGSGRAKDQRYW